MLLLACAIVPIATDTLINLGARLGAWSAQAIGLIHVAVMSAVLVAVVIEAGRMMQHIEELRRNAHELQQLQIERMPIACITIAADTTISSWNPAAARLFGYSAEEIVGQPAARLLPGGQMDNVLAALWLRLLAGNGTTNITNENITKDGRTIVCRWSNTPLINAKGEGIAVLSMAEDITGAQRAELALRHSEERHRDLINSLPHYVFSVDNDNRYLTVNTAACLAFGRPEREIIGRTAVELGMAPELAREWTDHNARTRATGKTLTLNTSIVVGGTEVRHTKCITSPLRDDGGTVTGVTGIALDVTEEKTAKATMQRFLRAVEQLDEVIFTTDRQGAITYVNPAFEKVYGYRRDEVIGKTPRLLKSGELPPEHYERWWSELLAGRSVRMEYRNRRKDGSLVDVIASANAVVDERGCVCGFIAVQQDISAQKRAAEERQRLDEQLASVGKMEALGTLAGGIAHDFNNILAIIVTHASLLERKLDPSRVARAIATIKQAVHRGSTLSRQILTFARRAEIKAEPLNVTTLLLELGSMISETMPRTIKFTLEADPDLPLMVADAAQIHQALLNLCVNACDAMPNGGELRIESACMPTTVMKLLFDEAQDADYIRIVVADNGEGMDEATQRRIFEPFFTTKPKGKGTGLGLALVYGVVKSHHGLIDVETQPGRGTEFRLYFPVQRAVAQSAPAHNTDAPGGRERLLVIEDEAAILEGLRTQLRDHGYKVQVASDGPAAIDACRRAAPPDAILMDLGMPKMIAADVVKALREVAPAAPVVAMTGYVDPAMHDSVVAAGVQRIVQKPFAIDDLLRAVRDVLDDRPISGANS